MSGPRTVTGVSEQVPQPQDAQPTRTPSDEREGQGARDGSEQVRLVQVTRRRAPRFRAFVLTGVVLALAAAAVVALTTDPAGGYSRRALFGYLFVVLGLAGGLLGGLVGVLADRTGGRGRRRGRR